MRCRLGRILFTALLLSGPVKSLCAQGGAKPLGMILDVQGTVNVQKGAATAKAQPADLLFPGDQVTTAANSTVTFSFCPSSQHVTLAANSAVSIDTAAIQQTKGAPGQRTPSARCALPQIALGKREIEHIGAMAARGAPPIAIYLAGDVSTGRPPFMWEPVPGAQEYKLVVSTARTPNVWTWTHSGQASDARMSATEPELAPGAYTWTLTASNPGNPKLAEQMANFEVKPNPELAALSRSGVSQLEAAAALENAGYYAEAAAIYRALQSQNQNDQRFSRQLVWFYWEMGAIEASNRELPKAKAAK